MNELEKLGFATFANNGDGWERVPNAKFMMRDEDGTEIEMTPNEVIKQLMQDNKSLEYCINNLQSKIDKINQYIKEAKESDSCTVLPSGKISDVGYCIDALEDIEDILKEDK